ncbi:MAG: glycosyltransferase family 4 protein [Candidatus Zambryskibacteria bacterium]|nr:glycosyltransferase family 4 protein [Candidatus Zambryskibacteria bacterium]
MKILVTGAVGESIPPPYGGIPKIALMWAGKWKEKGHKVALTFTYKHKNQDDLGAVAKYYWEFNSKPKKIDRLFFLIKYFFFNPILYFRLAIKYKQFHSFIKKEGIIYAAYGVFLDRVINDFKPDVIVAETALVKSFMATLLAKWRKVPIIIKTYAEVHDLTMAPNRFFSNNAKKIESYWRNFLGMADEIVAASKYCALGPKEYLGRKVKIIYGTALEVSKYIEGLKEISKEEVRNQLKIPTDIFLVVSVGAFNSRKGHDYVIKAVARLIKQNKQKFGIALCGAGQPDEWIELAKKEGIEDKLFIFQKLSESDLIKLYKASDVYVDASNTVRACLGMALTEGLASSLPAIIFDFGGLPESVIEDFNGYRVPLNDINSLSKAIEKMSNISEEKREQFGKNSLKRAKEVFDINQISNEFLEIINNVKH